MDRIVYAVFKAGYDHRMDFARIALDETGTGVFEHKVIKNVWASLLVYENIKNQKTVGPISPRPRDRDHRDRPAPRADPGHDPA